MEEQLEEEWKDYLNLVRLASRRPQSFTELMSRLRTGRKRFPLLYLLAQIVDGLPAHTACVERGFSLLNRLKDKKRASLDGDSLQDCMAICSNGVPLEEWSKTDALKAITVWSEGGRGTRHLRGHASGSSRIAKRRTGTSGSDNSDSSSDNKKTG